MSISLSPEQQRFVDELIQSGQYRSTEEIVRDAFDALRERKFPPEHRDNETGADMDELRAALQDAHSQIERGECRELTLGDVKQIVAARDRSGR